MSHSEHPHLGRARSWRSTPARHSACKAPCARPATDSSHTPPSRARSATPAADECLVAHRVVVEANTGGLENRPNIYMVIFGGPPMGPDLVFKIQSEPPVFPPPGVFAPPPPGFYSRPDFEESTVRESGTSSSVESQHESHLQSTNAHLCLTTYPDCVHPDL